MIDLGDRVQSEDGSKVQDVMTADQREAPGGSEGGPYPISAIDQTDHTVWPLCGPLDMTGKV